MKAEQLRKSILQLAIQGKLVPQDPADEPASVLLERIRAEKQRLIKEGKIKKDKGDSVIFKGDDNCYYEKCGSEIKNIADEFPFEIPDSWCWVRLSNIANISAGGTPDRGNPNYWGGSIPWLKISDITSAKKYVNSCTEFITDEGINNSSAKILPVGTILYTIFATIGEVGILNFNAACNQAIAGIQTYINSIDSYLYYYLVNLQDFMKSLSKGCAQFNINQKILKSALVPIPPLAEQQRIVSEIEKIEPLLAEYDKLEQQATKVDGEIYDKLKKSILQYAIQGKLVPQDKNDEPASELLKRIRAEKKIQLGKKYVESYIFKGDDNCYYEHINGKNIDITEEIPFDLPNGWAWSRLDNLALYKKGPFGSSLTKDMFVPKSETSVKVYEQKNAIYKDCSLGNYYISVDKYETMKSFEVFPDDIIVSCAGTIGETYVLPKNAPKGIINQALMKIKLFEQSIIEFYLIYFDYILKGQAQKSSKGSAIKNIPPFDILKRMMMPIPPLAEQKRIVDKIEEIFAKL